MKTFKKLLMIFIATTVCICITLSFTGCNKENYDSGIVDNFEVTEEQTVIINFKENIELQDKYYYLTILNADFETYNCNKLSALLKNKEFEASVSIVGDMYKFCGFNVTDRRAEFIVKMYDKSIKYMKYLDIDIAECSFLLIYESCLGDDIGYYGFEDTFPLLNFIGLIKLI